MANFFSRLGSIAAAVEKHPFANLALSAQWGLAKIRNDDVAANQAKAGLTKQIAQDNDNSGVVGALVGSLMVPYREIVNRPIGTAFGVARRGDLNGSGMGEFANLNSWRQAYNETDKFSLGQQWARASYAEDIAGMAKDAGVSTPTMVQRLHQQAQEKSNAALAPFLDPAGNLGTDVDPEEAKKALAKSAGVAALYDTQASDAELLNAFRYNPSLKYSSGAMDVASQIALDPISHGADAVIKGMTKAATVKGAEETDNALKALNGEDLSDLARGERRTATKDASRLDKLIKDTDGQSITELANSTWARSTNDASSVAALFSTANKIEDDAARWAAKRDIISVGLGNKAALDGLTENSAALRATFERISSPIEVTDAPVWKQGSDGSDVLNWWNSTGRLDENKAMMPQITAELDRMDKLNSIALSTNRVTDAFTPGEKLARGLRNQRTYETIVRHSPLARPIRAVTGVTGRMAQGYVNVKDGTAGFDQLRDTLHRSKFLDTEVKRDLLATYLGAGSSQARQLVVKRAEQEIWDAHATAHGLDKDAVAAFKAQALGKRSSYINMLSRLYSASDQAPKAVVRAIDEEGQEHAIPIAFLKTHLEDAEALTDPRALERAFGRVAPGNLWQAFDKRTGRFSDAAEGLLNAGTAVWKDLALFRGAYPMRVQVDTQLRLMAIMRGQYLTTAMNGVHNLADNWLTRSTVEDVEDLAARAVAQDKLDRALARKHQLDTQDVPTEWKLADIGPSKTTVPREWIVEQRKALNDVKAEIGRHQKRLAEPVGTITGRTGKVAKRRIGDRDITYRGVNVNPIRRTVDENGVVSKQANQDRDYLDRYLATDNAQALAGIDIADRTLAHLRANGNWDVVSGGEPTWAASYLRAVNRQLRNSPTAMRVLKGGSMSEIRRDVLSDEKMLAEWRFAHGAGNEDVDAWIHSIQGEWDQLATHPAIRDAAATRPLTAKDLRDHYQDVTTRPTVHGEGYSVLDKGPAAQLHNDIRSWWYKHMSDIPEQALGRHPLFVHNFKSRMKTMLDQYGHEAGQELDGKVLDLMRRNAMNGARKDITKVLFDTTGRSNLGHAVRHIMPFYAAWEDTITKWGRIMASDPRQLNDLNKVWTAPDDAGITTTDENGRKVVMLPKYLSLPGIGTSHWILPKGSFNLIFQGSDWWMPGFGPLIQAAANEGALHFFPDLADSKLGKMLLPYGVEDKGIAQQFLPAWIKRAMTAFNSDDPDYMKTYNMLAAQEDTRYKTGDRHTPPTPDELKRRTRNWYIARLAAANLMPFSGQPQPVLQFYMDKAKEYRNTYGETWQEQYYQDFPQYYEMTLGLTASESGIKSTDRAYNAAKKYKKQIENDPTYGWYFVGADNTYSNDPGSDRYFSQGVRAAQEASGDYRAKAPGEAVKDAQVSQGWLEYNQGMTYLRTQLEAQGLKTFTSKGAEDLKAQKDAFLEQLKQENGAWADAFDTGGSPDKIGAFLRMADNATADDSRLASRPDNQALAQWVQGRREIKAELAARESSSIDDPSNADLAEAWESYQGQLVASDIGFEQMFNRVLGRDDLSGDY